MAWRILYISLCFTLSYSGRVPLLCSAIKQSKDSLVSNKNQRLLPDLLGRTWCLPATFVTHLLGPFLTRLLLPDLLLFSWCVPRHSCPKGFCPCGSLCLDYFFQRHPHGSIPYFSLSQFSSSQRGHLTTCMISSLPRPLHLRWSFFPALSVSLTCFSQLTSNKYKHFGLVMHARQITSSPHYGEKLE